MTDIWKIKDKAQRNAAYDAHAAKLKPITARQLWETPDMQAFIHLPENGDLNLYMFEEIVGVDALTDGSKIILETGRTSERLVSPEFLVYVPEKLMVSL